MQKYSWLAIGVGALIIALLTGYYFGNNHDAGATSIVSGQSDSLESQAQCATQAQKALTNFEQQLGPDYADFVQQNHYNSNFNKCFVLVSYGENLNNATKLTTNQLNLPTNIEELMDAYENTDLADCSYFANRPGVDLSDPGSFTMCTIGNNGVPYKQYKDFVGQRMNLSE